MFSPDDMRVYVIVKTEKGMFGKCIYAYTYTYICIVTKDSEALNLKESEELCI